MSRNFLCRPHLEGTLEEAEANDCAADGATGEAACCAPAKSEAGSAATTAGNLESSMLKDLPTGAGYRRSATEKEVLIL